MSSTPDIKILQINLNKSQPATESALQLAMELNIDFIIVQEPWLIPRPSPTSEYSNTRSVSHQNFIQIFPSFSATLRPRTMIYVSKRQQQNILSSTIKINDPDIQAVNFKFDGKQFNLINIYNNNGQDRSRGKTIEEYLFSLKIEQNTIILGDFNLHHQLWEPNAIACKNAEDLVEWVEKEGLELLNTPGHGTFFRPQMSHATTIDLSFATLTVAKRVEDWQVLPDLGSDHFGIFFTIRGSQTKTVMNPVLEQIKFNTKKANWEKFGAIVKQLSSLNPNLQDEALSGLEGLPSCSYHNKEEKSNNYLLDQVANSLTQCITEAAKQSIPIQVLTPRSKPWWTPQLSAMRREMGLALKKMKNNRVPREAWERYRHARNIYFSSIKEAKKAHWESFLQKNDPQSIYKAMAYMKDPRVQIIPAIMNASGHKEELFEGKCNAFRQTLFPKPPKSANIKWDDYESRGWFWPKLTEKELEKAITAKVKGKTPGPDSITQEIIKHAFHNIPKIFFRVYSCFINVGYHPTCWKQATGAILKKPGKPDYSQPKAYRVISLLNCLGKVSERIMARRLSYMAETTSLLDRSQIGGRMTMSAVDAAMLLTTEIQTNKQYGLTTSAVFLDVKGAFDHVSLNQLLGTMKEQHLPFNLITWVKSFLCNRKLRLAFNGEVENFRSIDTGIPQGSPISPILFLIYIKNLFKSKAVKFLSYIDDICLTTASTTMAKNTHILQREVSQLFRLGEQNAIQFDLTKTEMMHFSGSKQTKKHNLILPGGEIVQPKKLVRWLGVWFDPKLSFKEHVSIRVSLANQAFNRLSRLANTERGLSPASIRQIYLACVISVSDYGSVLWWQGQKSFAENFQKLQNKALRKTLGAFRTSPIRPMEIEAALAPPESRLDGQISQYALRITKLPASHPIRTEIDKIEERGDTNKPCQINRIMKSINELVQISIRENIRRFIFPPWCSSTPIETIINKIDKEEATKMHRKLVNSVKNTTTTLIYTDASKMSKNQGIGIGFHIIDMKTGNIREYANNIGNKQLIFDGELEGIVQALELCDNESSPNKKFLIFSDNQSSIERITKFDDSPGQSRFLRALTAAQAINEKGADATVHWVPGHSEIKGNVMADKLAKSATTMSSIEEEMSLSWLGQQVRQRKFESWNNILERYKNQNDFTHPSYFKKFGWKPKSKIQIPNGTKRQVASAFFQLKLGHGYFKNYLYKLGHTKSSKCECGQKETPEHLMLWCKKYKIERRELKEKFNGNSLNMKLIMHTGYGIKNTLQFIENTGIGTRKWHLGRIQAGFEDRDEVLKD